MLTPTNLLVMCSHRGMHANPGIDETGGGGGVKYVYIEGGLGTCYRKLLSFFMTRESFWCNLKFDARLETIKWPFLD